MRKAITIGLLSLLVAACSKEQLVPLNSSLSVVAYAKVDANFCTKAPSPAVQKLKYLFVIDHSSSNKPGFPNSLTPTDVTDTDANGARRYGPLVNFVRNLVPDPNNVTSFNIIDFNDIAYQPDDLSGFEADTTKFINISTKDWIGGGTTNQPSPYDKGFTNYQAALHLAYQLIQQDAQSEAATQTGAPVSSVYQIIFVSDGVPNVAVTNAQNAQGVYTQTFADDLAPTIQALVNLKNDARLGQYVSGVSLNTAYYFNSDEQVAAEALLQQMASAGNGQYIQFAAGQNVLYQQFAPPSRYVINHLADVFIENLNGVWWKDRFLADSDGDGLPDEIERQFGSNPYVKDSDGNGVSDLIEYRTKGKPCQDAQCSAANRDPYAFCAGYSPVTAADGSITFSSSANDGLNDCEKFLLGGQMANFSSNGDLIPDFLAVKNGMSIIPGSAGDVAADPFGDGLSNYSKIKYGYPLAVSAKNAQNFEARDITLTVESQPSPQVSCYHLHAENVAVSAAANQTIRISIVQEGSTILDKPFLQTAERSLDNSMSVTFDSGDFK